MNLLPAIDLLGGRVVRLAQGDYQRVTVYHDDPARQAADFFAAGARWLHVVDLDGARTGTPANTAAIARICAAVPEMAVEVGGGVRTLAAIDTLLTAGVTRTVLGSALAGDPAFVREAIAAFGASALVAGVDARDGLVATQGWTTITALPAPELVAELKSAGLRHLVYTDIARDGMQSGIQTDLYAAVAAAADFPVIVSGGVASLDDLRAAAKMGDAVVEGIITGRALYEQAFTLAEALAIVGGAPC